MTRSATRSFPPSRLSVGLAARFAGAWLSLEIGEDDPRHLSLLASATTIVTDLVADAVDTAQTAVEVTISYAERVIEITVSADESGEPRRPRNLRNVDSLSRRWGIEVDSDGRTTVWCVLPG